MTDTSHSNNSLLRDCVQSFRALPTWVQIWVMFILMPLNMASLFFIAEPMGLWVAFLTNIAMMMNLPVMIYDRGFSKLMGVPHLIPWTALVVLILLGRPDVTGLYDWYLTALLIANIISLIFDVPDAISWFRGDRAVAGRNL